MIWSWQHVSVSISSVAELSPVYCCLVFSFFMMTIFDNAFWWQFSDFWKIFWFFEILWHFTLEALITCDTWDTDYADFLKSCDTWDTAYMWHLRHWLHCWQLTTTLLRIPLWSWIACDRDSILNSWDVFYKRFFLVLLHSFIDLQMLCVIRTKVWNKGKSKHSLSRSQTYTLIGVLGLLAACLLVIVVASQETTEDSHYRGVSWLACSWPA